MAEKIASPDWSVDPVSDVLKWILLAVGIGTFGILGWTVKLTYQAAPPFPDRFVSIDGSVIMTSNDVQAGKSGFQKADLMDYGSLYGMGSYFGEDYTASNLVRLATLTRDNLSLSPVSKALSPWPTEQRAWATAAMQAQLHGIDLTQPVAVIPQEAAAAIKTLQIQIAQSLQRHDFAKGWTRAYSLDAVSAAQTADFLIYSS
jgi:nitric oxide reductase subunit B